VPVFCVLLLGMGNRAGAAILLGVLGATDWVDGHIARRFDQGSELGKILDPTADRLMFLAAVAAAAEAEPIMAGKPNRPIVDCVRSRIGDTGVVVGDRPDSDGCFAQALGYEFALVLSGVTGAEDLPVSPAPQLCAPDLAALVDQMGFEN